MKKRNALILIFLLLTFAHATYALELTFNGNYSTSYTSIYKYTRTSYGLEIGFPLNRFMKLEIGESFTSDVYEYRDDYREYLISQGVTSLPAGTLSQKIDSTDTFSNLSLGLFNYYFSPSIFGGVLYRQQKSKDIYGRENNEDSAVTWDAGAALSLRITRYVHFKITYRISPAGVSSPSGNPYYDQSYWGGITVSL